MRRRLLPLLCAPLFSICLVLPAVGQLPAATPNTKAPKLKATFVVKPLQMPAQVMAGAQLNSQASTNALPNFSSVPLFT